MKVSEAAFYAWRAGKLTNRGEKAETGGSSQRSFLPASALDALARRISAELKDLGLHAPSYFIFQRLYSTNCAVT